MKIIGLQTAQTIQGGIRLTVREESGRSRKLDLTPLAERQFVDALLTSPPKELGRRDQRGAFLAEDVRLIKVDDGTLVLEAYLTPKSAIAIALPSPLPEKLADLLSQDPSDWNSITVN